MTKEDDAAIRGNPPGTEPAGSALMVTDGGGIIVSVNSATKRLFGYGPELIGQHMDLLFPASFRSHGGFSEPVPGSPGGWTREMRGLRKDGSEFPLELSVVSWESGGRTFFCASFQDTTHRSRQMALDDLTDAETSSRQLVESVQAIVWRGDAGKYRFTFVSKEAELILGFSSVSWVKDPDLWVRQLHPEDRDWVVSYSIGAALAGKDHSSDFRMIAADGRVVWFRNIVRVLHREGKPHELVGVMMDITKQKQSEDQLKSSREQLRALSAHLQFVREEERTRIAREIHDELGQVLTALKMDLSLLNRGLMESSETMPRVRLMEEIGSMRRLVDRTIQTVRRIVTELRPEVLDHLDLKAAIDWQTQELQNRSGIMCEFRSNIDSIDLDRDRATAMFRIFQEAMTNVVRHSNASRVNIGLMQNDTQLTLEITDNGRGISEADMNSSRSFGILGIKERALLLGGEVEIKGVAGQGTTVTVRVLYNKKAEG